MCRVASQGSGPQQEPAVEKHLWVPSFFGGHCQASACDPGTVHLEQWRGVVGARAVCAPMALGTSHVLVIARSLGGPSGIQISPMRKRGLSAGGGPELRMGRRNVSPPSRPAISLVWSSSLHE